MLKPKNSLISIDIARAFAALSVFYYHLHIAPEIARRTGMPLFKLTDAIGAMYAVPLFFLISGYCIHLSNLKYIKAGQPLPLKNYLKRRILRIYPPYLVAVAFSLVVNFITLEKYFVSWRDLFIHSFLLQGFTVPYFNSINTVFWTITVEAGFYILYPVLYYFRNRFSLFHAIAVSLIVSFISICYLSLKGNVSIPQFYFVSNLWFAWCCGAYIADTRFFDEHALKRPVYKLFYAAVAAIFIWKMIYDPISVNLFIYQISILIWTAPLLFLLNTESRLAGSRSWLLKAIIYAGLSSYSLYLFHEPLIYLKNWLAHEYLSPAYQFPAVITGIIVIPVITWFSYLYIEKPLMLKSKRLIND